MTHLEALRAKLEFSEIAIETWLETHIGAYYPGRIQTAQYQHAQLTPLITALLNIVEMQNEALEFECDGTCARGINPCNARETLEEVNRILEEMK